MREKIINILFVLTSSVLIYLGNPQVLDYTIFLLILITIVNGNYFSVIAIIPLLFINPILFYTFLIIYVILGFVNYQIKNKYYKNLTFYIVACGYIIGSYFLIYNSVSFLILQLIITTLILLVNFLNINNKNYIKSEILILSLSILNILYINPFLFIILYFVYMLLSIIKFNKFYHIVTAFFITVYAITVTDGLIYILIQIMAYLGYLYHLIKKKNNTDNTTEHIIEDMNLNISSFCSFLNQFSNIKKDNSYEEKLSSSIKILIESFCVTCKERVNCYGNKKIKTYIFLKELLSKENQINNSNETKKFFECKYYFYMCEKALQLQKQYNLIQQEDKDNLILSNFCSSIQNYFISLFEKLTPKTIKLINFKNYLIEQNVYFSKFDYSIKNENEFTFKIYTTKAMDLLKLIDISNEYFKKEKLDICIKNNHISISPKKIYKVIYDHASLSSGNCQISGDNIMFKTITETNFICALSDGMGSGYQAYKLSQETLKMVDLITNCNMSFDASLQILNDFFKAKDASDSYATLDLMEINLTNGLLNLYKLGSSTTYISRGDKIIPIYNNNLPFGINDLITKEQFTISNDDLIILVSDGISDYIDESKLISFIETIKNESPHKIVFEILQKIYYENGKVINDDMSCIVVKIQSI